jgi:hypothetical protein
LFHLFGQGQILNAVICYDSAQILHQFQMSAQGQEPEMSKTLEGKTAVITGASSGIGRAISERASATLQ